MKIETKPIEALSEAEAKAELERLAAEIARHDEAYHRKDAPIVRMRNMMRSSGATLPSRSGFRISSLPIRHRSRLAPRWPKSSSKITHKVPMLSLDNAFSDEDVRDFVNRSPLPQRTDRS
jgi:DNA ligase (NAD+)